MNHQIYKTELGFYYLHPDFIVCVSLIADPMSDWIDDIDLEEVCRSGVGVIEGLLLGRKPPRRIRIVHVANSAKRQQQQRCQKTPLLPLTGQIRIWRAWQAVR